MFLDSGQALKLKQLIDRVYSEPMLGSTIADLTPLVEDILDIHYFASFFLPNRYSPRRLLISNNPQEFLDVYIPLTDKDFLIDNLVETNNITVYRKLEQRKNPENREFNMETQKVRPVIDGCYIPLKINGGLAGFFAVARAGLNNRPLSGNDLEIFNFISGFMSEGFRRTLYVEPDGEDAAYLNGRGEVVYAGTRIGYAFKELFGERFREKPCRGLTVMSSIFAEYFRRFINSNYTPGDGDLFLSFLDRKFHLVFSVIPFPAYRPLFPEVPQVKVVLRKDDDFPELRDLLDFEKLDRKYAFTAREKVIIRQIYRGLTNKDISIALKISEATVKHHIWNIFNKTGADTRTQLVFMLTG